MARIRRGHSTTINRESILMKTLQAALLLGSLAFGTAMAADYSVGIVNAGTGVEGAGSALNLYSISNKGVETLKGSPYVFPQTVPYTGNSYLPILASIAPEHDLMYVVFIGAGLDRIPIIVQFRITPRDLVYQWQQELSTGDAGLQGSSISTVSNYVVEKTYPGEGLWIHILDRSGQEVVSDTGTNGMDLVSGRIDPGGKFYYSCRFLAAPYNGGPANAVAVYKLDTFVTAGAAPFLTSTDPGFVQSECS